MILSPTFTSHLHTLITNNFKSFKINFCLFNKKSWLNFHMDHRKKKRKKLPMIQIKMKSRVPLIFRIETITKNKRITRENKLHHIYKVEIEDLYNVHIIDSF
ncbi:hypothetical protein BpHYR1_026541 [Brachionus plicatilis]|uniref:Uncharacterized protein n=1 Tax=Brachionus plicatilis TaxID=10195 RepID=A0A3M7P712_BRAPC|nr:hypothetical protein BpHYR1_026541 [Brachionus plicatilis]